MRAILLCGISTVLLCGKAWPDICHQAVPDFSANIDSSSAPTPPAEPFTQGALELFRVKLDLYLKNTVEGYNNKLIAYGNSLDRLDKGLSRDLALGKCSPNDYEAARIQIDEQFTKIKTEYREPYRQGVTTYSEYIGWYKSESQRLKIKKQLEGALLGGSQATVSPKHLDSDA
jgi:hypothetical protein